MRYEQFKYVLEVAKAGSMRKAADNLYVSQPTLSEAIDRLEKEIGYRLFTRNGGAAKLTPQGEKAVSLLKDIVHLIAELENIRFDIDKQTLTNKEFNIKATNYFLSNILSNTAAKFQHQFPNITLNMIGSSFVDICHDVIDGKCDVGYISSVPIFIKNLNLPDYVIEKYIYLPMHLLINARSPLANKKSISLKDFRPEHKLVLVGNNKEEAKMHVAQQFNGFIQPEISFLTTNFNLTLESITTDINAVGMLYTSVPQQYEDRLQKKNIKILPLKEKRTMLFACLYHKSKLQDPEFCLVVDYFRSNMHF